MTAIDQHNKNLPPRKTRRLEHPLMMEFVAACATLLALLAFAACSSISTYDQTAYLQAVNTKVDALALMTKAVEPYTNHRNEVAEFLIELDKAYEYERGRPLNRDTLMQ